MAEVFNPAPVSPDEDPSVRELEEQSRAEAEARYQEFDPDQAQAAAEAAAKTNTLNQATYQSRYSQPSNGDWRVKLSLAPGSDYLYNSSNAGILAPLAQTSGVIFPYTPQINTQYRANYDHYDLVHSNYRGIFYKNSKVDDLNLRGTFTAQDTAEANYLLAVIHFFRSVTKMFYGQDGERGTPPPLVYLSGFGDYQFSQHPCVVSQFTYNLPDKVDYIRALAPNNYGTNLLNRRTPYPPTPISGLGSTAIRLFNTITSSGSPLTVGAIPAVPAAGLVGGSVANLNKATYVPTQMEIDITLIPVQSRSQVSKQFSLKGFANGDLLKGGFW